MKDDNSEIDSHDQFDAFKVAYSATEAQWSARYSFPKPSPGKHEYIIFYSGRGNRSEAVVQTAINLGLTNAKSLLGGVRTWNKYFVNNDTIDLKQIEKNLAGTRSTKALFHHVKPQATSRQTSSTQASAAPTKAGEKKIEM